MLRICADWPVEWLRYGGPGAGRDEWPEVEEIAPTYRENALRKAHAVADAFGIPAVADDSGIEVDALDGAPGPRSARFAGDEATEQQNLDLLIERLRPVAAQDRTARYRCVAACAWPGGPTMLAEGTCEGQLELDPRGAEGFGYDPIFVPSGSLRTMAEFEPDEKDAISHRGQAFRELGRLLARS